MEPRTEDTNGTSDSNESRCSSRKNMFGKCMEDQLSLDKPGSRCPTPSALPPQTVLNMHPVIDVTRAASRASVMSEPLEETLLSAQFVDMLNECQLSARSSKSPLSARMSSAAEPFPKHFSYSDNIILEICTPVDQLLGWSSCFAKTKSARRLLQNSLLLFFGLVSGYGVVRSAECIWLQYKRKGSMELNAANTARFTLLCHFIMASLSTYFIYSFTQAVPNLLQQWLRVYNHVRDEHVPLTRMVHLNYRLFAYMFICIVAYTTLFALSCADVDLIRFPGTCKSLICRHFDEGEGSCVGNTILIAISTIPVLYMQILYCLLCCIVYYEFDHFEGRFLHPTTRSTQPADQVLQEYRQQHFELVQLSDRLDDTVQYYTWWVMCFDIAVLCGLLYAQMLETLSTAQQMSLLVWDIQKIFAILFVALPASAISEKAYNPLLLVEEYSNRKPTEQERMTYLDSVLRTIPNDDQDGMSATISSSIQRHHLLPDRVESRRLSAQIAVKPSVTQCFWLTPELYNQISLFQQQLTNRAVGISCAGFFMLTKSIMLTLTSILITYFALILQMDMAASSVCTCDCANTTITGLFPGYMTTKLD